MLFSKMLRPFCYMGAVVVLCSCLAMVGCGGGAESTASSDNASAESESTISQIVAETPDPLDLPAETPLSAEELAIYGVDSCFGVQEIDDELFERMYGKSYKEGCPVPREDLRYVRTLHVNEDGQTLTGEMVVNAAIADEVCEIFRELYDAGYPIERMRLVDDYDADDVASMEDNNSSSFNYRPIAGTDRISRHGYGMAIDINTFYNPYYKFADDSVSPEESRPYLDREADYPYKIEEGDLCYQLFTDRGYTWGGSWDTVKDYQHFEK